MFNVIHDSYKLLRSYFWARNEIVFEIFHSFFLMNKKSNDSINKFSITLTRYVRSVTYSSLVSIPSSVTCSSRINLIFCAVCAVKLLVIRVNGWKQQKLLAFCQSRVTWSAPTPAPPAWLPANWRQTPAQKRPIPI